MTVDQATTLTEEQAQAIYLRDVSVALSAGAGCGKTFVLTERFLSYFDPADPQALEPHQIGQLIAITFTERAAREMRDRIRRKCAERLASAEGDDETYWAAVLGRLDSARISTIHSFCGALLRSHAVECGLDPRFQTLDAAQSANMLLQSIEDVLRSGISARDESLMELLVEFGLEGVRTMLQAVMARRSKVRFETWLDTTPEEIVDRWRQYSVDVVVPECLRSVLRSGEAEVMREILAADRSTGKYREPRANLLDLLRQDIQGAGALSSAAVVLGQIEKLARVQGGCGGQKDWSSVPEYEHFRDAAKEVRDMIKAYRPATSFDAREALPAAEAGLQLLHVAVAVDKVYSARKAQVRALDFEDLLLRTHELLTDPAHADVRRGLARHTRLVLVDEFQDTNPLQVEIVRALCGDNMGDGKLFVVGDYKQSIYRFLGADPDVFWGLCEEMPQEGQLALTLNFRSHGGILDFVNALFDGEMHRPYQPLSPSRTDRPSKPCIEFLWAPDPEDDSRKKDFVRREADWIARRLRSMIDGRQKLIVDRAGDGAGKSRAVEPGDIAVLFRALSDVQYYEEALQRYGIEYYLVGGKAYYAQQEIFDLLNLLRCLDSPNDAVSLAGALRSPLFSLEDETLFWLAGDREGLAAGLAGRTNFDKLSRSQRGRAEFAAQTLAELRRLKDRLPVADVIIEAVARTGYDAALLAEFMGERKVANLEKLIDQARSFDRSGLFTLADFILQLSRFVLLQPDEPLAAMHAEDTNVVRLMTIHQAKGLEFPVVVIPDLDREHQSQYGALLHEQLGPLVKLPRDTNEKVTCGYNLHVAMDKERQLDEIIRLLYVAATRASDYLILSSGVPELGAAKGRWMKLLGRKFDLRTGRRLDDDGQSSGEGDMLVTTTSPAVGKLPAAKRRANLKRVASQVRRRVADGGAHVPRSAGRIAEASIVRRQFTVGRRSGLLCPAEGSPVAGDAAGDAEGRLPVEPFGLGTLMHAVMAQLPASPEEAVVAVRRLAALHQVRDSGPDGELSQALAIAARPIRGRAADLLASAETTYREVEFLLAWPPDKAEARQVLLAGVIDRLHQDRSGDWHLVVFETNLRDSGAARSAGTFSTQIWIYAIAAEQLLGRPLASATLHSLASGDEIQIPLDAQSRLRVTAGINAAVEACDRVMTSSVV